MIDKISTAEVAVIFAKHSKKVSVSCDDEHAHSAIGGCLSPKEKMDADERDVTICKLCEIILRERRIAQELLSKITGD
jgi:hypothetical protein